MELLIKKEPERKDGGGRGSSQPIYIERNRKAFLQKNTKGVAKWPFDKEINQPSQQEARSYCPR